MQSRLNPFKDEIIRLYIDGQSLGKLARLYDCDPVTILNLLKKYNVARRPPTKNNEWDEEQRERFLSARKGKPSGALGKRWKVDRPVHKPSLRGENNPAWRGGIVPLAQAIRGLPEYRLWRDAVFQRDNYSCLHCGARSCKGAKVILNADHIIPFVTLLRQYEITSVEKALQCDALWDIENGRTLCESCHRKTETYGLNLLSWKEEAS